MSSTTALQSSTGERSRLPWSALLALATAGFLGIINETIPAGLLPDMAKGLGLSESATGQVITVYALATALTAIPLGAALKNVGRRTLVIWALAAFILANAVVALVDNFAVILLARFVGGVGAGLVWSNLGGIAARIVPERLQGRAVAIAMVGTPLALSLGVPAGTLLGDSAGWQETFGVTAVVGVALVAWMFFSLPNLPGEPEGGHVAVRTILRAPGVRSILLVIAGFMVAHNLLYTYIGPLADSAGVGDHLQWVLLAFGVSALLSIWATGALVDPHHRRLIIVSAAVVGASAFALGFVTASPVILFLGVAAWGLGFGGSATLFVTAGFRAAGTDAIQAIIVTVFNLSIAAGGLFGGLLLAGPGISSIPWVAFALMIPTVATVLYGSRHAFPRWSPRD